MGTFPVTLALLAKASLTRVRSGREGPILPPFPREIHLVHALVSSPFSLFLGVNLYYLTPQIGLPPQTFPPSPSLPPATQDELSSRSRIRPRPALPAGRDSPGRILHPPGATGGAGAGAGISSGCHTARWKQDRFHVSNRKHLLRHITPFSYSRE